MAITAAMVRELREKTGLPMMECKSALDEAGGDEAKAIEILRAKGLKQISKRSGRSTSEGRVACHANPEFGRTAIVELLCETQPVADNDDFRSFLAAAASVASTMETPTAEAVLAAPDPDQAGRTLQDRLNDVINRIRENIKLGRMGTCTGTVGHYLHHDAKKGVLVEFSETCPDELRSDVCMHIVAMRPPYARREEVPADDVEREREHARGEVAGKPENIIDKIVTGKLNKWYADIVLLEQPFVKDDKQSVQQVLRAVSPSLTINRVLRFEIGEG